MKLLKTVPTDPDNWPSLLSQPPGPLLVRSRRLGLTEGAVAVGHHRTGGAATLESWRVNPVCESK
jgi:hypothetical protein